MDLIEHTLEIDNYISASVKIPKVLSAIEFKGIMMKVDKLLKLAESPIVERKKVKTREDELPIEKVKDYVFKTRTKSCKYTKAMNELILDSIIKKVPVSKIIDIMEEKYPKKFTKTQMYNKVGKLKKRLGLRN